MKTRIIISLIIFLLTTCISSADNYVGGIPPVTIHEGTISGGVYYDSYYGSGTQANYHPITIDKTFTVPDHTDIDWAMLLTTVYCGHMNSDYRGTARITFNGDELGDETLKGSFVFKRGNDSIPGYLQVNDHVIRVTSDYMIWYDVTNRIQAGDNIASVHTEQIDNQFDGRIKLITLIAAYNDGSGKTIHYWINKGHDVDSYRSESLLNPPEDYIGSTTFSANLPSDAVLQNAEMTAVHMASTDGSYTFNSADITSGIPQGTFCGSNTWDVTGNFNPDGINTMTYDRTAAYYKIAFGILMAEYQEGTQAAADINISSILVKHNYYNGAWEDLCNTVTVNVVNNGDTDAASFNVILYADDVEVDTISVPDLASGASTDISFDWTPADVKTYSLKAVVGDNDKTISQSVEHNGYMGDKTLVTYAHDIITGDIFYTHGSSRYSGKLYLDGTYTVTHDVSLPEGTSVKFARLYNYWCWSGTGNTPVMSLTFDGTEISPEVTYEDIKGWGYYNTPAGTWAYDITDFITGSGTHTTVVTNKDTTQYSYFAMNGLGLLVVYEDPNGQEIEYWINEGADMLSTMDTSGGLMTDEATTISLFAGSIDRSSVESARLWTVVQSGGWDGNALIFNNMEWTGIYDATPYSDLDIDEARDVKDYLIDTDNTALIRAAPYEEGVLGGDYLMPSNAFLILNLSQSSTPLLSISASQTTVTGHEETDVTFTVTSGGIPVESVSIALSGCAEGNGISNADGTVIISVNASGQGTITALASKQGYTSATMTLTAISQGGDEGSSTVSLIVKIRPEVSLVVTPGYIDFGELAPGETSSAHTLTLMNEGTCDIDVTAEVVDTAQRLFEDGLLLDSSAWGVYATDIAAETSKTTDASLAVPEDYVSVGTQQGTLMFWAQA